MDTPAHLLTAAQRQEELEQLERAKTGAWLRLLLTEGLLGFAPLAVVGALYSQDRVSVGVLVGAVVFASAVSLLATLFFVRGLQAVHARVAALQGDTDPQQPPTR